MRTEFERTNPPGPLAVSEETFAREVLDCSQPVLVDAWAPWCGPCRMIAPVIDELAADYAGRVRVVKLNVDENPETAGRYGISSIPTFLFFKHCRVVDQVVGAVSKKALAQKLEALLN